MTKNLLKIYHNYEVSTLKNRIKYGFFNYINFIGSSKNINTYLGVFIMIINYLQIASVIGSYASPNTTTGLEIIDILLNYTVYSKKLEDNVLKIYTNFIFSFIIIVLIFSLIEMFKLLVKNGDFSIRTSILSYSYSLIEWIFLLPFSLALVNYYKADSSIGYKVIIVFCLIILFSGTALLSYFSSLSNLVKIDFFTNYSNSYSLYMFYLKILVFMFYLICQENDVYLMPSLILTFIAGIFVTRKAFEKIILSYDLCFSFSYTIGTFVIYERVIYSCIVNYVNGNFSFYENTSMNSTFHYNELYLAILITIILIMIIVIKYYHDRLVKFSLLINFKDISRFEDLSYYLFSILEIKKTDESNRLSVIQKEGIIIKYLEDSFRISELKNFIKPSKLNHSKEINKYFILLIKDVLEYFKNTYHDNFQYRLTSIFCLIYHIDNLDKALCEIEITKIVCALELSEEFILYLLKDFVNERIVQISELNHLISNINNEVSIANTNNTHNNGRNDNFNVNIFKQNSNSLMLHSKWATTSLLKVYKYNQLYEELKRKVYLCYEAKRKLWKILSQKIIVIENLYKTAEHYFDLKQETKDIWKDLLEHCNENADYYITHFYCRFLKIICQEEQESEQILDRRLKFIVLISPDELYNDKFKGDTGILIIDAFNYGSVSGSIAYANTSFIESFEFSHLKEILGKNVSSIMPKVVGTRHDRILENYFQKGYSPVLKKTLNFLCIKNSEKYLIPMMNVLTILPCIDNNIQGLGLFRRKLKSDELIVCDKDGRIDSLSKTVSEAFKLTPLEIEKQSYYIYSYLPDLLRSNSSNSIIPKFFNENAFSLKRLEAKMFCYFPKEVNINKNTGTKDQKKIASHISDTCKFKS